MNLSYLNLTTTDPAYNLAAEQYIFDCLPRDRAYFMLWQNDNAVIIGKYQNTLAEINQPYVQEHGIRVVRRLSGGGAVYHDLGNLNFTFIADTDKADQLNLKAYCRPVVRTLQRLGVQAEINGRNDITIDGRKFSGNSQYIRGGRTMHHGTILFCSDLDAAARALRVDAGKIQGKGIRSVRSRMTNVSDHLPRPLSLPEFRNRLLEQIVGEHAEEYRLTRADLDAIELLRSRRYAAWEWNYGGSPPCTLHKDRRVERCGRIEAYIHVAEGRVAGIAFRGDFFSSKEPQDLAERLVGCRPDRRDYAQALRDVDVSEYFSGLDRDTLIDILSP